MTITFTPLGPPPTEPTKAGQRMELATYATRGNERRRIVGQRIDGVVRVTDEPAHDDGSAYLIEQDLHMIDELDALVTDYLAKADALGYPPMRSMRDWF